MIPLTFIRKFFATFYQIKILINGTRNKYKGPP